MKMPQIFSVKFRGVYNNLEMLKNDFRSFLSFNFNSFKAYFKNFSQTLVFFKTTNLNLTP